MPTQVQTITQVFPAGFRVESGKMGLEKDDGQVEEHDVRVLVMVDPESGDSFVFPLAIEAAEKLAGQLLGAGSVNVAPASALSALDRLRGRQERDQGAAAAGRRR